ncbi:MAG: deoxyguanosinetriphosphate triphosphohydrolase family protein [Christensenellaceae bacterium]|jgi:dGTPase
MDNKQHFPRYDEALFGELYTQLKKQQEALSEYASPDKAAVRRKDEPFHVARPNFVKDTERILYCRYYNRYADKTQVFSLYKNDDITRRVLHVQIVSRIARSIGRMLNLNQDLIEAISLGHDLGHTPFGHAGERFLSALYFDHTGRYFNHNVHSVRILDKILGLNLTFQVLDGILCHNGEQIREKYYPFDYDSTNKDTLFQKFDEKIDSCYTKPKEYLKTLRPSTLEGCVVRLSDIVAYLGKDRQDASILGIEIEESFEKNQFLGSTNSEIISNIIANVVKNSYQKDYIMLDDKYADALIEEKITNHRKIYSRPDTVEPYANIKTMFEKIYEKLLSDTLTSNTSSPIFRHHINKIYSGYRNAEQLRCKYLEEEPNQIVVDYIASMTDDYFIDLYEYLFPGTIKIEYKSYFSDR